LKTSFDIFRFYLAIQAGFLLVLAGAGLPAQAQVQFIAQGQAITVSVGMPGFAARGAPEVSRQSGMGAMGHVVINELIPKGESFEAWSSLYAIKLEEGIALSFEAYVSQLLGIYLNACDMEIRMVGAIQLEDGHVRLIIPCQSYRDNPATGELAMFDIRQQDDDFINIYQHWRGAAFSADDVATWPADSGKVGGFLRNADAARITAN